jgi:NADPH:quinone reductase-like Zn-dependent oxidoreductase
MTSPAPSTSCTTTAGSAPPGARQRALVAAHEIEDIVDVEPSGIGAAPGPLTPPPPPEAQLARRAIFGDGPVAGTTILVHGVLGGVGSMAAQLARWVAPP